MKILFTGGGTGGHFYPIIAVVQAIQKIAEEQKYVGIELYFMSDDEYNKRALFENHVTFVKAPAGKNRVYFSLKNILDYFKTGIGLISATWKLYALFPDVIFAKGGYASFPALFAAKLLKIPVVLHESDSVPGRVNEWAGKFAQYIGVSYAEAASYFPKDRVAVTGNPVRSELIDPITTGAREFFDAEVGIPIIYVTGGSTGAMNINDVILDVLPDLIRKYTIVHQVGKVNYEDIKGRANVLIDRMPEKNRYKIYDYLDVSAERMIAGTCSLVISRAGSTIFEISAWGVPSIIIPIPKENSHGDHQRRNAYNYAASGGAVVIEEKNLAPHILLSEIDRILSSIALQEEMRRGAKKFFEPNAASKIAGALISIGLEHE
ncbi:MAG: UDP-N-acetylglucosamine--N-acetylmuramyl-(pentapeptide) pyrophosphoryl-undecaprenol N-acetylglucosamine transferase [Candidatus Vogelbacteria bacterium]|nr:UDP-N-acetylglucosamine--N-acetylmuramyl-(pentapeptide) pyrophosphoryl-undecaprenol N-acetylglucosamine transferase [Candidatus Vogelbacteria bacterium]